MLEKVFGVLLFGSICILATIMCVAWFIEFGSGSVHPYLMLFIAALTGSLTYGIATEKSDKFMED